MIKLWQQPRLWEGLFAEEPCDLREPRMRAVDELLDDDELLEPCTPRNEAASSQSHPTGGSPCRPRLAVNADFEACAQWSYDFWSGRCGPMYLWGDLAVSSLVPLFPSH